MNGRALAVIIPAIMVLNSVSPAHVRNGGPGDSLKGLRSMFVTVHVDGKSLVSCGLTNAQVWSAVVLRLRLAGLNVLNEENWEQMQGKPYLSISLSDTVLSGSTGHPAGYVCTCSFDLMQEVSLVRQPGSSVDACTWSRGATVIIPPDEGGEVRMVVDSLATEFTSAVTAANQEVSELIRPGIPLEKR
jgi:hypothetical protein